jgi:hypothetical protein
MDLKSFLMPKTFSEKKSSMIKGFFAVMGINFLSGIFLFFMITGYRLRFILNQPILALVTILLMMGMFYFSILSRKMAIACREFTTFEELRTIFLFFVKRFTQLIIFPLIILAIQIYKMNDFKNALLLIVIATTVLAFLLWSEWKLINRQWENDQLR